MTPSRHRPPRSIPASEFKAHCLALMDDVARTGAEVVITKHGRVVAKLVPATEGFPSTYGWMDGTAAFIGDPTTPEPTDWLDHPIFPEP